MIVVQVEALGTAPVIVTVGWVAALSLFLNHPFTFTNVNGGLGPSLPKPCVMARPFVLRAILVLQGTVPVSSWYSDTKARCLASQS